VNSAAVCRTPSTAVGAARANGSTAAPTSVTRTELAVLFTGLTPEQWEAPSLCAGRRAREVVAHMSTRFRYPTGSPAATPPISPTADACPPDGYSASIVTVSSQREGSYNRIPRAPV
jgi:hypothetical protein